MKIETWLFGSGMFFFTPIAIVYGWLSGWEAVGTVGLLLTAGLGGLIGVYLAVTSRRIDPRPEDDPSGEIAEAAGELGFFAPHSWWPLPLALAGAVIFTGLAVGWWLFYLGVPLAAIAVVGWVYEHSRGEHAH